MDVLRGGKDQAIAFSNGRSKCKDSGIGQPFVI